MEHGNRRLQYYVVSAVCSASVTAGVSFAWATPVLPKFIHNEVGFPISKEALSWIVSVSSIGFVIGCCAARLTSDKYGRRTTILTSSLPIIIGTILMIFAWEAWMLSSGRLFWGVGTGMTVSISSVYIAEIADKDIRGRLSLAHRYMLSFGCLLVNTVGVFVSYQTINYMLLALPVMFFVTCWWIPESPYFLLKAGKVEAARKTLQILSGIRDENVLEEKLSQMQSHVLTEMKRSSSLKEFLTGKRYRRTILIVLGIKVPQIMTGLHAVQNYMAAILIDSDSGISIAIAVMILGLIRFLSGIMSSVLVDRIGRRPLLIGSFFGTGVLLAVTAVYFRIQTNHVISYPFNLTPFVVIIMCIVVSILGFESVSYLLPAELFPMNVKSIAIAMVTMFGGLFNFISVKTYQQTKDWIGLSGLFGLYAGAAFVGAAFCYFQVPETKGKSLKEIQVELHGNIYDEEEKLKKVSANNDKIDNGKAAHGNIEGRDSEVSPLK